MQTVITSEKKTVIVDIEGPFTIIGEKINPTGRKKMAAALQEKDYTYICDLVIKQVEGGADKNRARYLRYWRSQKQQ